MKVKACAKNQSPRNCLKIPSRSVIHSTLLSYKEFGESGDSGEFDIFGELGDSGESDEFVDSGEPGDSPTIPP